MQSLNNSGLTNRQRRALAFSNRLQNSVLTHATTSNLPIVPSAPIVTNYSNMPNMALMPNRMPLYRQPFISPNYRGRNSRAYNVNSRVRYNNYPSSNLSMNRRLTPTNPYVPNVTYALDSGGLNDLQTITKTELWFNVIRDANKYVFIPGDSGIPHLDRFASIYENYQVRYLAIHFKSSSGTVVPGNLTYGIDYNPHNDRKRSDIPLLEPNASGNVFTPSCIKANVNRIMKGRTWLYTAAAATQDTASESFALYVDANTMSNDIGQIWVEYKIAFCTATSPSGSKLAQPIAICTSTVEVAGSSIISPATNVDVSQNNTALVSIEQPTITEKVTKADEVVSSDIKTVIKIDNEIATVGSEFTVGAVSVVPADGVYAPRAFNPKISFKYSDGSEVPSNVIAPVNKRAYLTSPLNADFFSTVFSILKPLVKPVLGYIADVIDPPVSSSGVQFADDEDTTVNTIPDTYTTFAFEGDTATITIPNPNILPLASRLSTNLVLYGGVGIPDPIAGYNEAYDANVFSYDDNWVSAIRQSGGTGVDKVWEIDLGTTIDSFSIGDLVLLHLAFLGPLDAGFGSDRNMQMNTCSPDHATVLIDNIAKNATLDGVSAELLFEFQKNKTSNRGQGVQNGLTIGYRIQGIPDKPGPYKIFGLKFRCGNLFDNFSPLVDSNIPKPDAGYALCFVLAQISIFPTVNQPNLAMSSLSFELQKIDEDLPYENVQNTIRSKPIY